MELYVRGPSPAESPLEWGSALFEPPPKRQSHKHSHKRDPKTGGNSPTGACTNWWSVAFAPSLHVGFLYGAPTSNRNGKPNRRPTWRVCEDHQPAHPHRAAGGTPHPLPRPEWFHEPAPLSSTHIPFCDSVKPQLHKLSSPAPRKREQGVRSRFDWSRSYFHASGAQSQQPSQAGGRLAGAFLLFAVQGLTQPQCST